MTSRRLICAVVGSSAKKARHLGDVGYTPSPQEAHKLGTRWNTDTKRMAWQVGRWAAEAGFVVLTGGMTGVMESAILGARECEGLTMSILPGEHHHEGVAPADLILPSGIGYARNYLTALACDLMVALPGGQGTLQEVSFASDFGRTVLSWDSWKCPGVQLYAPDQGEALRAAIFAYEAERSRSEGPGSEAR